MISMHNPTVVNYIKNKNEKAPLVLIGDVIKKLGEIPDKSVDVIVTSPPYYKQREYDVEGEVGQERTSEEYVNKMVEVGNELRRVLKAGLCL